MKIIFRNVVRVFLLVPLPVFFAAAFVGGAALITGLLMLRHTYNKAAFEVCDLVRDNYYLAQEGDALLFDLHCRKAAARQTFLMSKAANIERINGRLSELRTSHLAVFNPEENRQMWENEGLDSGIRARQIEEFLVVVKVVPASPAAIAGVHAGDVVLSINHEDANPWSVINTAGEYIFRRGDSSESFTAEIVPVVLHEDMNPSLKDLGHGRGYLRIPSFLAQYFDQAPSDAAQVPSWRQIVNDISKYRELVIDIRDNSGGSFPGMLRALSPFRCADPLIGQIYRQTPEGVPNDSTNLRDALETQSQLEQLAEHPTVRLQTFSGYGCFEGPAVVLINAQTTSVAEIFAESFLSRPRSLVMGQPSGGQVVMARWFSVFNLGSEEFQISIPIAGYLTASGASLEEHGVIPQKYLFYSLPAALRGEDSWLASAESSLQRTVWPAAKKAAGAPHRH